ncbi:MAG: hypothetical protein QXL96_09525 [Ignisphaera sp.]
MLLILTHDVDWSRRGPRTTHILDRLNRFDFEDKIKFFALRDNIYNGIPLIMEYEQRQGIKSTFFFRSIYEDGSTINDYSDIVSELRRGGWEVGLHANNGENIEAIALEKNLVEKVYAEPVVSMRVHYLKINPRLIPLLSSIGIKFDSSLMFSKNRFSKENSGCIIINNVIELPITIMDTYMFTYWGINPLNTYEKLLEILSVLHNSGVCIATILWHTNSVRMIGGRDYLRFVEEIWRLEWIKPIRIRDIENYLHLCKFNLD